MTDDYDEDALFAGADLVNRSGAKSFEVGYLHDDVPSEKAAWWAKAQYAGAVITVEGHRGPVEAVEALARRILAGGMCAHCNKTVALSGKARKSVCRWRREGPKWIRGCE